MTELFVADNAKAQEGSHPGLPGRKSLIDDEAISRFDILNLFGKQRLEEILQTIALATGLGLIILDYKGDAITEPISFTPFCQKMREGEKSAVLCRSSFVYGTSQALARQRQCIYLCPCGFLEVSIPIIVKNHFLGSLYAGQVRCDKPPKGIPQLAKMFEAELAACPLNAQQKKMYRSVAVYEYEKFAGTAELISLIISQLSEKVVASQVLSRDISHELTAARDEVAHLETELSLKKSEVTKLKSRLNYYFLINTLNAISNLAVIEDSPRTNEMIILCAEHLKHGLPVSKNFVLLAEETENVERFLKMQKIRFGSLLNYSLNVSSDAAMRRVPVHVIMPFVERAVFYGLTAREAELNITLTVSLEGPDVVVQVTDDGPGLSEEELSAKFASFQNGHEGEAIQMGLAGARQRLSDLFGREYEVEVKNIVGRGTECVLRYPASLPVEVL
ncbi:PocR ligand-binding domain-containing protein [Deltaproteobacteria bacterium OttesenSCG-928-K17]|nr:PocR ligand-binding domain-containing protein [Deltaproteobacteria bacterium OttesenSCG-928-K17]